MDPFKVLWRSDPYVEVILLPKLPAYRQELAQLSRRNTFDVFHYFGQRPILKWKHKDVYMIRHN